MDASEKNRLSGIDVSVLSGTGEGDEFLSELSGIVFGADFDGLEDLEGDEDWENLNGLDDAGEERLLGAIYNHMARTRSAITRYPQIVYNSF